MQCRTLSVGLIVLTTFCAGAALTPQVRPTGPTGGLGQSIETLQDGTRTVAQKVEACKVIVGLGAEGKAAVPALKAALKSDAAELRVAAATALHAIGPGAADALWVLMDNFQNDTVAEPRHEAGSALLSIGAVDEKQIPVLCGILKKHADAEVRMFAGLILSKWGGSPSPHATDAIPDLIEALRDTDAGIRGASLLALSSFGARAGAAITQVTEIAKNDPEPQCKTMAIGVLNQYNDATDPFCGSFSDQQVSLAQHRTFEEYSVTLTMNGQTYPGTARLTGNSLAGGYIANGKPTAFTATIKNDSMTFVTAGTTHQLAKKRP